MAEDRAFVDTGAWLAVLDPRDQYHVPASAYFRRAIEQQVQFHTTNLVIAETYSLLQRRVGHRTAIQFLDLIGASQRLTRVSSTPALEAKAEIVLRRHSDQSYSYVDAVSFCVMEEQKVRLAFAFDRHFETMGFVRQPQPD
jgi:uncharacterized protein